MPRDSGVMAPVPGQRRLMIIKMVLENFKSYAGVKEIGPFHKCFSSVVGPNGSGKSNVIDAMLFVFGKRAKKLRLNKVSELIHKSEDFPHLEHATVSVHFQDIIDTDDGDNGYEVVPGSEVVVTRTAFLNNQSKYLIDGKTSSFGEVTEVLKGRGIDLDNNRFLILQGEVEQIAMMRPKAQSAQHDDGLLEYLEDIIGSNRHVPAITQAAEEVDQLNEARAEQLNRVKISEKEKENLEEARAEALALLGKERDLRVQRSALYQLSVLEAQKNVGGVEKKHQDLSAKLTYEQGKLQKATGELEAFETDFKATRKDYEDLSQALLRTKDEFAAFERRDIKLQEDAKHLKAQQKKLKAAVDKEAKKAADALATAQEREAALPGLEKEAGKARAKLEKEEAQLALLMEGLKGKTEVLRGQLEAKQAELAPKTEALLALQARVDTIETEARLLRDASSQAQRQLEQAQNTAQELEKLAGVRSKELEQARARVQQLGQQIEEVAARLSTAEEQEKVLSDKMQAAVSAAESARTWLQQSSNLSTSLREVLRASGPGGALAKAGVCGRLGDLGAIDPCHDVALSTACGGFLDFVVVQTAQGAAQCVEFLRANNLGRASFIILEQLAYLSQPMDQPPALPPNTPRLFDLVRPSEARYRPAFYMCLRNTLLARDLDSAVAIAYEGNRCKWRVVTSDGQLIDQSGAMSGGGGGGSKAGGGKASSRMGGGGGAAVAAGGGGAGGTEEEAARLEAEAKQAEERLRQCRASKRQDSDALRALTKERQKLEASVPKLEVEIANARAGCQEARDRVTALADKCKMSGADAKKLSGLEKEQAAASKELQALTKDRDATEAEVKALQAGILDVGGPKLKQRQDALDHANAEVEKAVGALEAARVEVGNAKRTAERAQKAEAKAREEGDEVAAKLEATLADKKQLEEDAFQVTQAFQEAEKAVADKSQQLEAMTRQHQSLVKAIDTIKKVEVDIVDQLDEYERVRVENKNKQQHWAAELDKLRKAHAEDLASDLWDDEQQQQDDDEEEEEEEGEEEEEEEEAESMDQDGEEGQKKEKKKADKKEKKRRPGGVRRELRVLEEEQLVALNKEDIKYRISLLEQERDALRENVNMSAIAEWRAKDQDFKARLRDLDHATDVRNEARKRHDDLRRLRLEEFMAGFGTITLKLKEMYQMITLGGDAELELVDPLDPFSEGIVFSVRPPKKSWKNISNLSGGEKTLSSLALVFALHHYKPTPLYVMDEIDAALDFKNVAIVANYIKERTKNAQFIIISLRNNMFELADRLVGIYKVHNATGSITINPHQLAAGGGGARARKAVGDAPAPRPLQERTN